MYKRKRGKYERFLAIVLAAILALGLVGCSSSKNSGESGDSDSAESEATTEAAKSTSDSSYAASDVVLPDNFDTMIYPLEALMVQNYSKGYEYYTGDEGADEADSFWYSMAVLTSLMETESAYGDGIESDSYYYLQENTMDMYASTLYDAYAKGNMEFPEIPEEDKYATYDDEQEMYGLIKGDIGDLTLYITDCTEDEDGYIIDAQLRDAQTEETKGEYIIAIAKSSFEGDDNYFVYAVTSFSEGASTYHFDEETEEDTSAEGTTEEKAAEEETTEETGGSENNASESISQDSALDMAKEYYGDDVEYSYKETVTVGDKEYYDFSVEGDEISSSDVLVSVDGEDVIGGTKNDDGTWSFDQ